MECWAHHCSVKTETPMVLLTSTPRVHATEDLVLFEAPRDEAGRAPHHSVMSIRHHYVNTMDVPEESNPSLVVGGQDRAQTNMLLQASLEARDSATFCCCTGCSPVPIISMFILNVLRVTCMWLQDTGSNIIMMLSTPSGLVLLTEGNILRILRLV